MSLRVIVGLGVVEGRSLPIDIADVVAAKVAAAADGTIPSSEADIGRLSDGLWQRYGEDSISPALLAYWQETCSHIGPSRGGRWSGSTEDVLGYLKSFHRVCDGIPKRSLSVPLAVSNVCVVISQQDAVAPAKDARSVFESRGAMVVASHERSHASADGLRECLEKVRSPNTQAAGESGAADGANDVVVAKPDGARPEVFVDAARLGWKIIEEHGCEWGQEQGDLRWNVELGSGPLNTAHVVAVTQARQDSPVAALYRGEDDQPLQEGWLTSARPPRLRIETLPDGSLLVVEGVPAVAVGQRAQQSGVELSELDAPCWGQRWNRRATGEELSDATVLYGDAALIHLIRDRSSGAELVADPRHPNTYRYASGELEVALFDLRPQAVILLTAHQHHPLPETKQLKDLISE